MPEFIVSRSKNSIGPQFNEAADILKKHKNLKILASKEWSPDDAVFLVKTTKAVAHKLEKELTGWRIGPDVPVYPASRPGLN